MTRSLAKRSEEIWDDPMSVLIIRTTRIVKDEWKLQKNIWTTQNKCLPAVGPAIGPDVGPDVGPAVGPDVGPEVGPEVGPKKKHKHLVWWARS